MVEVFGEDQLKIVQVRILAKSNLWLIGSSLALPWASRNPVTSSKLTKAHLPRTSDYSGCSDAAIGDECLRPERPNDCGGSIHANRKDDHRDFVSR